MTVSAKVSFLPISLGIRRQPDTGETDLFYPASPKITEKVLARDGYACRCCGFTSKRYQRVISAASIKGTKDEYITVCLFCEWCFALDRSGAIGSTVLIWLPELDQASLNHVLRAIYVGLLSEGPLAEAATRTLDVLIARRAEAKKRLGSDDPILLATSLQEQLNETERAAAAAKLEGIRLLPLDRMQTRNRDNREDPFSRMVRYWMSAEGPYGKMPTSAWLALLDKIPSKSA